MNQSLAGWHPDPTGRHEHRYFDGNDWTDHVADQGNTSTDPLVQSAPVAAPAGPSRVDLPAISPADLSAGAASPQPAAAAERPAAAPLPGGERTEEMLERFSSLGSKRSWQLQLIGGGVLFIALFLPWYTVSVGPVSANASAFEAFSLIDLILLVVALVAAAAGFDRLLPSAPLSSRIPAIGGIIVTVAGLVAVALIVYRLLDLPVDTSGFGGLGGGIDIGRGFGLFLGLAAAIAVFVGGAGALAAERRS